MSIPAELAARRPALLIVDDDALIIETLAYALGTDFEIHACDSRRDAIDLLRQLPEAPELALVDLGLPPAPHAPDEGFALIGDLLNHAPGIRIFVLSGQNDAANGRHARALGATEFIAKPCEPAALRRILARALALRAAELAQPPDAVESLLGDSPPMQRLRSQIRQFADSPFPVLIEGESGSGKELAARSLHRLSARASRPCLALNCAAIAPTLVEPTLFGYAKGAFTGATAGKSGYFEDALDGTLFLDEIGELPIELQAKLLRVLENGEYQRVGETTSRVSRARIVAATNRDLRKEMSAGRFRTDLYHRLSVLTLGVPPLRELGADRMRLLDHFRHVYATQTGAQPFQFAPEAEARWLEYGFPGNVRELRNIVIRLTAKHSGQRLGRPELDPELDLEAGAALPDPAGSESSPEARAQAELRSDPGFSLDERVKRVEHAYIEAALRLAGGNVSEAARLLGIPRTTLYNRMAGDRGR